MNTKRRVSRNLLLTTMVAGGLAAAASTARLATGAPATIGGQAGFGWPNGDRGCFQSSFARMINFCSTTKLLIVPMWRNATFFSSFAFAGGSGSPNFQSTACKSIGVNSDGSGFASANAFTTGNNVSQFLRLERVSTDENGTWHVECQVPSNGFVQSVGFP
jgi:hypothetical protein